MKMGREKITVFKVRVYYKCNRVFLYNVFMNVGFMFKMFELLFTI